MASIFGFVIDSAFVMPVLTSKLPFRSIYSHNYDHSFVPNNIGIKGAAWYSG